MKTEPAAALCPYCGAITPTGTRCSHCRGLLDPLSRQATTNTMGPWFIRDDAQPYRPGCSYHTLVGLIQRGKITRTTIIRGPSTRQFWMFAGKVPGVAHLLGVCHSCQEASHAEDFACNNCGAVFTAEEDRQRLGLGPVMEVPGQTMPEVKPTGKEHPVPAVRRPAMTPSPAPMSAIMDDAPWQTAPRKSSGALVGGVVLAVAAIAAAGFAVKTWVDANKHPPSPQSQELGGSTFAPQPSLPDPAPPSATESINTATTPAPLAKPAEPTTAPKSPEQPTLPPGPEAESPAAAQLSWSSGWRHVRGLP